jgi:hypothetical protein
MKSTLKFLALTAIATLVSCSEEPEVDKKKEIANIIQGEWTPVSYTLDLYSDNEDLIEYAAGECPGHGYMEESDYQTPLVYASAGPFRYHVTLDFSGQLLYYPECNPGQLQEGTWELIYDNTGIRFTGYGTAYNFVSYSSEEMIITEKVTSVPVPYTVTIVLNRPKI